MSKKPVRVAVTGAAEAQSVEQRGFCSGNRTRHRGTEHFRSSTGYRNHLRFNRVRRLRRSGAGECPCGRGVGRDPG